MAGSKGGEEDDADHDDDDDDDSSSKPGVRSLSLYSTRLCPCDIRDDETRLGYLVVVCEHLILACN